MLLLDGIVLFSSAIVGIRMTKNSGANMVRKLQIQSQRACESDNTTAS